MKERMTDAQVEKMMREAVLIGVQTAFSAMQGGAQVAANPMIAPIADSIMQGQGYQRPNPGGDDPNFLTPEQAAVVQMQDPNAQGDRQSNQATGAIPPVRENTSPTYPPVPQDPGSPMQGIETPTTDDNITGAQT